MKFGLERMRRLLTALGSPQRAFRAIHVVGTNGKSSTVRMAAAILEAHGVRTGAYLSPHLSTLRRAHPDRRRRPRARRLRRRGRARRRGGGQGRPHAVGRRARDPVRAAHRRGVLRARRARRRGRRWSRPASAAATTPPTCSPRRSRCSPTSASSTRAGSARRSPTSRARSSRSWRPARRSWSGELDPEAEAEVAKVDARVVRADPADGAPLHRLPAPRTSRSRAAARRGAQLRRRSTTAAVLRAASSLTVPGRFQVVAERAADDLRRRAQPLGRRGARRRRCATRWGSSRSIAVLSVLDDKDAAGMLRELVPLASGAVFTASRNPRALQPGDARLAVGPARRPAGRDRGAIRAPRSRGLSALAGEEGAVVATGSIYLVADLLSEPGRRRASAL